MTNAGVRTRTDGKPTAPETAGDAQRGWYFYGITKRGPLAAALADASIQLLEWSDLMAVVRPVLLADFSPAVMRERLTNEPAQEAMVRSHNDVIEAIRAQQAILPARFGMVCANARDIVSALRSAHDSLLRQLDRLEGCDEWALHLYADRVLVRELVSATDFKIRRLRQECAGARPGRAYFLERQLRDELEAATHESLMTLAQETFDQLVRHAVACQMNLARPANDTTDEVEILRASFLVTRDSAEHFMKEVRSSTDASAGLRCDCSGPWPPYSFASWEANKAAG